MKHVLREASQNYDKEFGDDEIDIIPLGESEEDYTYQSLLLGIAFFALIIGLLCGIVTQFNGYSVRGYLVGVFIAYFMVWHMNHSTKKAFEMPEINAKRHLIASYFFRAVVVFIAMALTHAYGFGDVILILLGIINLKISVYFVPITEKIIRKILKKGG